MSDASKPLYVPPGVRALQIRPYRPSEQGPRVCVCCTRPLAVEGAPPAATFGVMSADPTLLRLGVVVCRSCLLAARIILDVQAGEPLPAATSGLWPPIAAPALWCWECKTCSHERWAPASEPQLGPCPGCHKLYPTWIGHRKGVRSSSVFGEGDRQIPDHE